MKIIKSELLNEVLLDKIKKVSDPEDLFHVTIWDIEIRGKEVTVIHESEHKERGFVLRDKLLLGKISEVEEKSE